MEEGKGQKKDKNKKGQPKKAKGKTQEKSLSAAEEPAPRHWGFQILFPCPMGPQLGSSSWDGCDAHDRERQEVVPKAVAAPTPAGSWSSWKEGEASRAPWDKESCWSQALTPQKLNHSQPFRMSCSTGSPRSCFRASVSPVGRHPNSFPGCNFSNRKRWFQLFHLPFHPALKARGCKWLWGKGFPLPDFGPYSSALGWLYLQGFPDSHSESQ